MPTGHATAEPHGAKGPKDGVVWVAYFNEGPARGVEVFRTEAAAAAFARKIAIEAWPHGKGEPPEDLQQLLQGTDTHVGYQRATING